MRRRWSALFLIGALLLGGLISPVRAEVEAGSGVTVTQLAESMDRAAAWLEGAQDPVGTWGSRPSLVLRDTASVVDALRYAGRPGPGEAAALDWLRAAAPASLDSAARRLATLAGESQAGVATAALMAAQNTDGGWGAAPGYRSNPLDTALALRALTARAQALSPADPALSGIQHSARAAVHALVRMQNADGSWGVVPGAAGAVFTTATANLALQSAADPHVGIDPATPAVWRAGRWLAERQNADGSWGTGQRAGLTALAYRAALLGVPVTRLATVPAWLIGAQADDGSWHGQAFATAQALEALSLAGRIPSARLGEVRLLKLVDGQPVEADHFAAYETALLSLAPPAEGLVVEAVVSGTEGARFTLGDGGVLGWNTGALPPGPYQAVVLLRDPATGLILDETGLNFTIDPTVAVRSASVMAVPGKTGVGTPVSPQVVGEVRNGSNVPATVKVTVTVTDGAGHPTAQAERQVELIPGADPELPPLLQVTPDVSLAQDYTVALAVHHGETLLAGASNTFRVLPPPPPTRVDVTKTVAPTELLPGEADVLASITLTGQGDATQPERQPLDLVLTIDVSPSMTWGDTDWVPATPSRLDGARAASKLFVDMLGETDRSALVRFSWSSRVVQNLTYNHTLTKNALDTGLVVSSGTGIGLGMRTARTHLQTYGLAAHKPVVLLLSDGDENYWSLSAVRAEADEAARRGIVIYTIGLGATANRTLLADIAARTGGAFYFSPTIDDLEAILQDLGRVITAPAGADVRVTDTIPGGDITVDPAAISPAPHSVNSAGGQTVVEWRFPRVAIGESINLGIGLHLTNLQPGEERVVNQRLVMTYVDAQGQTVTQELGPYTVTVADSAVDSALSLDKAEYTANEPVTATATVINQGAVSAEGTAVIEVRDAQGGLVATLATEPLMLAAGESRELTATWNTGTVLAGSYTAVLRVTDPTGSLLTTAQQPFQVTPFGQPAVRSSLDQTEYAAGDEVRISHQVTNRSSNAPQTGLTVLTEVTGPDGTVLYSHELAVSDLMPGASAQLLESWPLGEAAPGTYTVRVVLKRDGEPLTQEQLTFAVADTAETGAGLSGSLTAQPNTLLPSGDVTMVYQVTNGGNGPVAGALVRILLADPETAEVAATLEQPLNAAPGETVSGQLTWSFDDRPQRPMLAAMSAVLANGTEVPLASTGFRLVKPFDLAVSLSAEEAHRILVWSGPGAARTNVTDALDALGYPYTVVEDAFAFQAELRTGLYTAVVLPGAWPAGSAPSDLSTGGGLDHLDWELREKVYGGLGLIVFGDARLPQLADENHKRGNWLGIKADGFFAESSFTVDLADSAVTDAQSLQVQGKVARARRVTGTAVGLISGTEYQAAVTHSFGQGRTLWTAFDAAAVQPALVQSLLGRALSTMSVPDATLRPLGPAALVVTATGGELPVSARVSVSLTDTEAHQFELAPGEVKSFRMNLQLPDTEGSLMVQATGAYLAHGTYHPSVTAATTAAITRGPAALIAEIRSALIAYSEADTRTLRSTLDALEANPPSTQAELDQAIHRLLQDIRAVELLGGGGVATAHRAYVQLLGYYQARWAMGR